MQTKQVIRYMFPTMLSFNVITVYYWKRIQLRQTRVGLLFGGFVSLP